MGATRPKVPGSIPLGIWSERKEEKITKQQLYVIGCVTYKRMCYIRVWCVYIPGISDCSMEEVLRDNCSSSNSLLIACRLSKYTTRPFCGVIPSDCSAIDRILSE